MFGKKDTTKLKDEIRSLEKDKTSLKKELEELKLKKKIEEEDIKHMVRINNERKDIELEKEKIELERKSANEVAVVKDQYRDKTEKQLEKQLSDMRGMYGEILARLPNYNVKVKEER